MKTGVSCLSYRASIPGPIGGELKRLLADWGLQSHRRARSRQDQRGCERDVGSFALRYFP